MSSTTLAAVAPLILLLVAFEVWCLVDITRHTVKHLPRWVWVLITLVSVPTGGIAYFLAGRGEPVE